MLNQWLCCCCFCGYHSLLKLFGELCGRFSSCRSHLSPAALDAAITLLETGTESRRVAVEA